MLRARTVCGLLLFAGVSLQASGCASPYHADRGALFGGVMGAGLGAVAGAALGNPAAGAALGGVAGTMTGAVVGSAIDDVEARNQAEIAARLGRPAPIGAIAVTDVVAMTHAGVSEEVIATQVRNHGLQRPLQTNDLIYLQQSGVSPHVVQAMQSTAGPQLAAVGEPYPLPPPVYLEPVPPLVIEQHHHFGPPPPYWRGRRPCGPPGPRFGWGVSMSSNGF